MIENLDLAAIRCEQRLDRLTRVDRDKPNSNSAPANSVRPRRAGPARVWAIAVKFAGIGPKILDPRLVPIEALDH